MPKNATKNKGNSLLKEFSKFPQNNFQYAGLIITNPKTRNGNITKSENWQKKNQQNQTSKNQQNQTSKSLILKLLETEYKIKYVY